MIRLCSYAQFRMITDNALRSSMWREEMRRHQASMRWPMPERSLGFESSIFAL